MRFRNWNPQGQGAEAAEEVCLLLCSEVELSALGDVPEVPVVVAEGKISGAVSAAKVAGLPSPANRSATHTVWVIK